MELFSTSSCGTESSCQFYSLTAFRNIDQTKHEGQTGEVVVKAKYERVLSRYLTEKRTNPPAPYPYMQMPFAAEEGRTVGGTLRAYNSFRECDRANLQGISTVIIFETTTTTNKTVATILPQTFTFIPGLVTSFMHFVNKIYNISLHVLHMGCSNTERKKTNETSTEPTKNSTVFKAIKHSPSIKY